MRDRKSEAQRRSTGREIQVADRGLARGIALAIVVKPGKLTGSSVRSSHDPGAHLVSDFQFE
jgi:hypothetical protein